MDPYMRWRFILNINPHHIQRSTPVKSRQDSYQFIDYHSIIYSYVYENLSSLGTKIKDLECRVLTKSKSFHLQPNISFHNANILLIILDYEKNILDAKNVIKWTTNSRIQLSMKRLPSDLLVTRAIFGILWHFCKTSWLLLRHNLPILPTFRNCFKCFLRTLRNVDRSTETKLTLFCYYFHNHMKYSLRI